MKTSSSHTWGSTEKERSDLYRCDNFVKSFDEIYFRAVSVFATKEVIFRWLCQLKIAPYSYDWIDNFGRKSPIELTPGADQLTIGEPVMTIFELLDFERNKSLTIRIKNRSSAEKIFGEFTVTYQIIESSENCRLIAKVIAKYPNGLYGRILKLVLPFGDMIMMRKQLLTLKQLSESSQPTFQLS